MAKRRPPPLPEVDVVLVSICTPSLKGTLPKSADPA